MSKSKILVLSEGPPPIGDAMVEGGGLRAWGLATSLATKGFDVTYAFRFTFKKPGGDYRLPKNISLRQWSPDNIKDMIGRHTHILIRYSMGEMGLFIDNISEDHIVIADCYIPIAVEYSARPVLDANREVKNYISESYWWQRCVKRADYFLYASDQQLHYYMGYLSAILKLNPVSYGLLQERLLKVPYGYFKKDILKKTISPECPSLVWYGGIYPWFDMNPIVEAAKLIRKDLPNFKLIIAGAKNPYTDNVAFLKHYAESMDKIAEISEFTDIIGHTPYKDRFSIYGKGSTIITLNKEGLENELAWRTRLADYIAARKPIITNGGDPLGEKAISAGIAVRIDNVLSPESIKSAFMKSLTVEIKNNNSLVEEMTWENNISNLSDIISNSTRLSPELATIDIGLLKPRNRINRIKEGISYSKLVLREQGIVSLLEKLTKKIVYQPKKLIRKTNSKPN